MKNVIVSTIFLLSLVSCKKTDNKNCTISKIVQVHLDSAITMLYYNDNKIMKSIRRSNLGSSFEITDERTFEYKDDTLIKTVEKRNGVEVASKVISYQNNAIRTIDYSMAHRATFYYNNRKLSKLEYRHISSTLGLGEYDLYFTYSGENIVEVKQIFLGSAVTNTITLSYTNFTNTLFRNLFFPNAFSFDNDYTIAFCFSDKLVSKVKNSGGGKFLFSYKFMNGQVSRVMQTFTSSVNNHEKKVDYEYSCN